MQILKMWAAKMNLEVPDNAAKLALFLLKHKEEAKKWAQGEGKDDILAAYGTAALLPGHAFFGYKSTRGAEERWGFSSGDGGYEGKNPGEVKVDGSKVTHYRHYKACPATQKLIKAFVDNARSNVPYYHWNAGELGTLNGKKLSNCHVFAMDAIRAGKIDVSDLGNPIEPWDLANHSNFTAGNGGSQ
jgi:hypothetical protein